MPSCCCAAQVNIAAQVYDFIDKHIQHLDEDLKVLGAEVEADKKAQGLGGAETACDKLGVELRSNQRKQKQVVIAEPGAEEDGAGGREKRQRKSKKKGGDDEPEIGVLIGECAHAFRMCMPAVLGTCSDACCVH